MPKLTVAQSAAINDYNKPMLVSASAGSGKTFTLIKKLVKYLEQGDLDNLVVLTFTKAAAAEMKNKLATELIKEIKANNNAKKFSEQLNKINTASIGTIDSFCNDIYSKYFEVAGLDPNLSIISQEEDSRYIASAFDSLLEKYLQDKSNKYNKVIYMLSENRKFNIEIIETIIGKVSLMPVIDIDEITAPYDVFKNERFVQYIRKIAKEASDAIDEMFPENPPTNTHMPKAPHDTMLPNMKGYIERFLKNTEPISINSFLNEYDTMVNFIESQNLDISSIYTAAKKIEKLAGSLLLLKTSSEIKKIAKEEKDFIEELIGFAIECLELARAKKQEDGYASYADIEKYAYEILSANNNLQAKEIAKNIDLICIDEYQDTNYMQEAIINCFEKDKLFFVGDIKQSIYGFRNANPLLFDSRYNTYMKGLDPQKVIKAKNEQDLLQNFDKSEGAVLFFSENFRSSKRIIDFVNAFFSEFMTEEFGKVDYKKNSMMEGRDIKYENELPAVIVSEYEGKVSEDVYDEIIYSVKNVPIKNKVFVEAATIVQHINYLVGKNIYEDMSTSRPIEYKDIAILARKNKDVKKMIEVLEEHNIPAKSSINSEMSTEDRALILSIMELLDNPYQDVYLIHVLLSFFGGFNEKELAEISGERTNKKADFFHKAFFKFSKNNALKKKIDAFIAFLDKYRKLANSVSVSDLIMAIATETGYDALLMYDDHARINAFNIFVSYIKSIDTIKNIRSLLSFIKNSNIDETLNDLFSTTMEENAVIVETMHRSKGLEYPIVFIMSHNADNNRYSKTMLYNKELGFACDTYDFDKRLKTEGYIKNFIKHFVKKTEEEEDLRLIYVAFTRAKNHLIIMNPKDKKNYKERQIISSYLMDEIKEKPEIVNLIEFVAGEGDDAYKSDAPTANAVSTRVKDMVNLKTYCKKGAKQKKVKYKYPYEESVSIEGKYSVTAINEQSKKGVHKRKINPIQDTQNIEKGITYHKVLELVDFNKTSKAEVESQLQQWHNAGIINKDLIDIDLMCEILNNKIFDRARIGKTLREQKFYYRDKASELLNGCKSEDLITVQGIIDLVIISGDEVILVDYKYTTQDDESVIETYKEQIEVYKKALEKVAKYKVTESYIFSLKDNKVIKM